MGSFGCSFNDLEGGCEMNEGAAGAWVQGRGLFFGTFTVLAWLTRQRRSDIPLRKGVAFADPTKCDAPGAARLAADGRRTVAEPDRDDRQPPRIDLARSPNAKSWLSAMSGCSPIGTVSNFR